MKTCVSKILKVSTKRCQEHQASGNMKRLEHQAPGDRLLQKILQVKRKFIFIQILVERHTPGSSRILQEIPMPQNEEEHEFHIQVLNSMCGRFAIDPTNLQDFQLNVAIWSQFMSECTGLHLASQCNTMTSKGWR